MQCACTILWPARLYRIPPPHIISHKAWFSGEKKGNWKKKVCFGFTYSLCGKFFILGDIIENVCWRACKVPLLLLDVNKTLNFDVMLTVHLSIILITNLMYKFLFYNKFTIFLYMFRALLCTSLGGQFVLCIIWYRHTL